MVDSKKYSTLKIDELKEILKSRNLSIVGRKQQLIDTLIEADKATEEAENQFEEANEEEINVQTNVVDSDITKLTEEERVLIRKQKFGIVDSVSTSNDRLKARAERFGITSEKERMEKRAMRFGLNSDEEILKKRALRFGLSNQHTSQNCDLRNSYSDEEWQKKLLSRKLRFGI